MFKFFFFLAIVFSQKAIAQSIVELTSKPGISIRGLSVLDDNHAWVSGTKGHIGQTDDGGKTWKWLQVPGYENRDFRDIELTDANTAIVMAIDTPAILLRTTDKATHFRVLLMAVLPQVELILYGSNPTT